MSGGRTALDWEARFRAERTPWERPTLNPAFTAWRQSGLLAPCRILLPGAGRSGEPLALAQAGFDVTAVDSAPTAVAVQRARMEAAGASAAVVEADLLAWSPAQPFDAVYDQTCLCALPPESLAEYAGLLHAWLRPGGRLFVLLMQTGEPGGPPFDCPPERMRGLFDQGWRWPERLGAAIGSFGRNREIPAVLERV